MDAKQLKDSILQYAMQGKLVPQDLNDEPAIELLKRIKEEKEQLIAQKVIKKEKVLPEISEKEIPFEIPETWEWCRIKDVYFNIGQKKPDTTFTYIDVAAIDNKDAVLKEELTEIESANAPSRARKVLTKGDVIYATVRPYLKNIAVIDREFVHEPIASTAFVVMTPIQIEVDFLYYVLVSPMFDTQVASKVQGVTYPAINDANFNNLVIPVPPKNEQKRIVEQINKLQSVVSAYGEKQERLNQIQNNFPVQLEKSILQYAMRGKLVPQIATDEPASRLIERIKAEKERLVKEKVIKKEKALREITEDEIPFEIPSTWEWVRVEDVCLINPKNKVDDDLEVAFIPMKLIDDGFVDKHNFEIKKWGDIKKGFTHFQEGDVVVAKITPCFENRKSAVLRELPNGIGAGTTELYVIRPILNMIYNEYLLWLFKSHHFISNGVRTYTGTAGQQRVSKSFVENYLIPLPPYQEQIRIVQALKTMNSQINCL
ncbi:hypothetical protein COD21_02220 [Bacillus cereus]|uniref:restriction endonuclease subunit S n=1 Tax=Bacillus cereus TaxID=1396 RepID=UPI000BFDC676|nr:restriction endonuclease subunit S [Bacillus cereus]PGU13408.1 hypothetical protein COD21_02220 [Bacillus cereus]